MKDKFLFDSSAIITLCSMKNVNKLIEGWTLDLAEYEIGNAVWKQVHIYKNLKTEEGILVLDALNESLKKMKKIEVKDILEVFKIAIEEGLTYYDASYLHEAIKNKLTLVTDDKKLYRIAKKKVRVLTGNQLSSQP